MNGKSSDRPRAAHVSKAIRAVQRRAAESPNAPAAHVQAAVQSARTSVKKKVQKKTVDDRPAVAAHLRAALERRALAGAASPIQRMPAVAEHVRRAIARTAVDSRTDSAGRMPTPPVAQRRVVPAIVQSMRRSSDEDEVYDLQPWLKYSKNSSKKESGFQSKSPNLEQVSLDVNLDKGDFDIKGLKNDAQDVRAIALIDHKNVQVKSSKSSRTLGDIQRPDSSLVVIGTINDGEVRVLPPILDHFLDRLTKAGDADISFEVRLSGAYGACDGCKKRIAKFAQIWGKAAAGVMKKGKKATLTMSYFYLKPPEDFYYGYVDDTDTSSKKKSKPKSTTKTMNTYGWPSDANQGYGKGPFLHVESWQVIGF